MTLGGDNSAVIDPYSVDLSGVNGVVPMATSPPISSPVATVAMTTYTAQQVRPAASVTSPAAMATSPSTLGALATNGALATSPVSMVTSPYQAAVAGATQGAMATNTNPLAATQYMLASGKIMTSLP